MLLYVRPSATGWCLSFLSVTNEKEDRLKIVHENCGQEMREVEIFALSKSQ